MWLSYVHFRSRQTIFHYNQRRITTRAWELKTAYNFKAIPSLGGSLWQQKNRANIAWPLFSWLLITFSISLCTHVLCMHASHLTLLSLHNWDVLTLPCSTKRTYIYNTCMQQLALLSLTAAHYIACVCNYFHIYCRSIKLINATQGQGMWKFPFWLGQLKDKQTAPSHAIIHMHPCTRERGFWLSWMIPRDWLISSTSHEFAVASGANKTTVHIEIS